MRRYRDLPIRRKLVIIGWVTSVSALLLSAIIFIVSAYLIGRRDSLNGVEMLASIVANNLTAAASFEDRQVAAETLRALSATPTIDMACAYTKNGEPLAQVSAARRLTCPNMPLPDQSWVRGGTIVVVRPIDLEGRRVGTLHVQANLTRLEDQLRLQGLAVAFGAIAGLAVAIVVAAPLYRLIARSILSLSSTSERISRGGNYSLRAEKAGADEIGALVDVFNEMVSGIERRDEQLRAANRSKDEFLATLSHELRTPLNAIVGWLQILQTNRGNPEIVDQAIVRLDRNARAQARLIEDLLDISRIVSGKLELKLAPLDLSRLVEAAVDVIRPSAAAKRIALALHVVPSPCMVSGDPDRLQQVVVNVMSNAVKFTAEDGRIDVRLESFGSRYVIVVRDNGIGIAPAFLPRVFDRFRQADGSITRQHGGLGLGLSIARDLMALHHGRIEASSEGAERGATFTIEIPQLPSESAEVGESRPSGNVRLDGVSILVADDDLDSRTVAHEALSTAGARVAVVSGGREALEALDQREFDVFVSDIEMPDVDGYSLLRQVRDREWTKGRFLPAVAVTAHAGRIDRARAKRAGFQAFVIKPYDFSALAQAVALAMEAEG